MGDKHKSRYKETETGEEQDTDSERDSWGEKEEIKAQQHRSNDRFRGERKMEIFMISLMHSNCTWTDCRYDIHTKKAY